MKLVCERFYSAPNVSFDVLTSDRDSPCTKIEQAKRGKSMYLSGLCKSPRDGIAEKTIMKKIQRDQNLLRF